MKRTGRRTKTKRTTSPVILVIEDNPITLKLVQVTLRKEGYQVVTAPDGRTALEYAMQEMPDLILQDLKLPDIDGIDLVRKLRDLPGSEGVPILAFTGFVNMIEEGIITNAGFTDFLIKPVENAQLIIAVRSYLLPRKIQNDAPGRGRRLLLVDDDPTMLKYARLQFTNTGFEVIPVPGGAEALQHARKQPPDIIVSDTLMPGMDGFQLCYAVRQDPALREVPVVLMSANYVAEADRKLAAAIGASDYLYRSLGMNELTKAVVDSLARAAPAPTIRTEQEFEQQRLARVAVQLDRMVSLRANMRQRGHTQTAILNELSIISETLTQRRDPQSALEAILTHCLDGVGLSKGLLYLADDRGRLDLYAQFGCGRIISTARDLFGQPELFADLLRSEEVMQAPSPALPPKVVKELLARTQSESALAVPVLGAEGNRGLMLMLSTNLNLVDEDWVAFGNSLAAQIAQTILLSQTILKLANSEERYRTVIQATNDVVWDWNLDTNALWWNENFRDAYGQLDAGIEPRRESWTQRLHPEDKERVLNNIHNALEGGAKFWSDEYHFRRADGSYAFIYDRGFVIQDANGKPCRMIGAMMDITKRKQAENELQAQLNHLKLLHQITRSIGKRQDLRSIFQVVIGSLEDNLAVDFCCVCLYDPADNALTVTSIGARSEPLAAELALTEQARIDIDQNGLSRCLRGQLVYEPDLRAVRYPFPQRLAQGGLRALVMAPLLVESKVFGILIAARGQEHSFTSPDCEFLRQLSEHVALATHQVQLYDALQQAYDDLRQTQQAILQQERLRALGQMASGIAHDINNAISPVALYTESLLETEPNLSAKARDYLVTIQNAVEDVAQTVSRMREFYRHRETQLTLSAVHLNRVIEQAAGLTRARWSDMAQQRGAVIEICKELAPDLPAVMGVESEIREALTNLIFNAVDAMPDGGTLTLRTRQLQDQPQVAVEVIDTGLGMDEETRRRCLEPFYTTKGERGTGLGLAMVFGTVQRHSADIEIDSVIGRGTIVRLIFAVPTEVVVDHVDIQAMPVPSHLELLIVDDDPLLIKSLRDTLAGDGHTVTTAMGGREGIEAFRLAQEQNKPFAVVITDLGMPYVDGRKVSEAVKTMSPYTPVIMLTGWGQRLVAEGDVPPHVDHVLSKPPKLRELRAALAKYCSLDQA